MFGDKILPLFYWSDEHIKAFRIANRVRCEKTYLREAISRQARHNEFEYELLRRTGSGQLRRHFVELPEGARPTVQHQQWYHLQESHGYQVWTLKTVGFILLYVYNNKKIELVELKCNLEACTYLATKSITLNN